MCFDWDARHLENIGARPLVGKRKQFGTGGVEPHVAGMRGHGDAVKPFQDLISLVQVLGGFREAVANRFQFVTAFQLAELCSDRSQA